jgi:hypothetical protein
MQNIKSIGTTVESKLFITWTSVFFIHVTVALHSRFSHCNFSPSHSINYSLHKSPATHLPHNTFHRRFRIIIFLCITPNVTGIEVFLLLNINKISRIEEPYYGVPKLRESHYSIANL